MKKTILEKIINLIREEGPTMTSGSNPQGFSSAAKAEGAVAGFDPVMGKPQRRKKDNNISERCKEELEEEVG